MDILTLIVGLVSLIAGSGGALYFLTNQNKNKANIIIEDAKKQSEQIRKEKNLQAKEKFIELKSEHDKIINQKNNEINKASQRASQKENTLNQKLAEVNKKDANYKRLISDITNQKLVLEKKQNDLDISHK